jgi:hypothetical protein
MQWLRPDGVGLQGVIKYFVFSMDFVKKILRSGKYLTLYALEEGLSQAVLNTVMNRSIKFWRLLEWLSNCRFLKLCSMELGKLFSTCMSSCKMFVSYISLFRV